MRARSSRSSPRSTTRSWPSRIARFGSDSQKQTWLRRLASGQSLGAFALSEEHAGSDAANQQTVARLDDRGYALNGRKVWVANAEAADLVIVFAATQPGLRGRGVSAFLVPMDSAGITRVAAADSLGVRGLGCMDLEFRDVRVDAECLLGAPGDGFRIAMWALEGGRVAIAAQALGVGEAALAAAVEHARTREAFGQPIGNFQAIQWMIADMASELDAARMLTLKAADLVGRGSRQRPRPRRHAACLDGQALRVGGRPPRGRQGDADSGLEGLPPRLGRRAPLQGRARDRNLPGHVRSPADGDRRAHSAVETAQGSRLRAQARSSDVRLEALA